MIEYDQELVTIMLQKYVYNNILYYMYVYILVRALGSGRPLPPGDRLPPLPWISDSDSPNCLDHA